MLLQRWPAGWAICLLAICATAGCHQAEPPPRLQAVFVDLAHIEDRLRPAEPQPPLGAQPSGFELQAARLSPMPVPLADADLPAPAPPSPSAPVLDAANARLQQLDALLRTRAERIIERERVQEQRLITKSRLEASQRLARDQAVAEAQHQSDLRSVRTRHGTGLLALEGTLRRVTADPEAVQRITAQIAAIQKHQAAEEAQARFRDAQRRTANAERYQEFIAEAERSAAVNIELRAAELRADASKALADHRAAILATARDWTAEAETNAHEHPFRANEPLDVQAPAFVRYKSWGERRPSISLTESALEEARRTYLRLRVMAEGREAGWNVTFEKGPGRPDRTTKMVQLLKQPTGTGAERQGQYHVPTERP